MILVRLACVVCFAMLTACSTSEVKTEGEFEVDFSEASSGEWVGVYSLGNFMSEDDYRVNQLRIYDYSPTIGTMRMEIIAPPESDGSKRKACYPSTSGYETIEQQSYGLGHDRYVWVHSGSNPEATAHLGAWVVTMTVPEGYASEPFSETFEFEWIMVDI